MAKPVKYACSFVMIVLLVSGAIAIGDEKTAPPASDQPTSSADTADDKINVIFTVTPRQDKGKLFFDVETNLPDGMLFMCTVRDEIGMVYKSGSTMERLMTEVVDGEMTVGPLPLSDRPFPSGEYTLYIYSYDDDFQPENVIEVIGEGGANLTGSNVVYGMVVFGKEFMITGSDDSSSAIAP